jgi:hypothetical protein
MLLQAEELPPEIWLSIFTFLEGHDLVRAFSCLNSFFDSLLRSPHLQLHIRIKKNESNERLPNATWSHINRENIYSLTVGRRKANCLIQFLRWNAQYLIHLSSLSICLRKSNSYYNIQFLIFALEQLPSLNRLRIKYITKLDSNTDDLQPLMVNIFNNRFTIQNYAFICNMCAYSMKTSTWSINPCLKSLYFDDISFSNLYSFLSFTPHLYSLRSVMNASLTIPRQNVILHHLQKVNLYLHHSRFVQLQMLKEIIPNLLSLRLRGVLDVDDENYFKENLWYKLFDNIQYFNVNLTCSTFTEARKAIFKNYIQNFTGKSWFSSKETQQSMEIFVKFQSG